MTKTRFNRIVARARRFGEVIYDDHGERLSFSVHPMAYGMEYSLKVITETGRNTVECGYNLDSFRHIMVD